MFAFASLACHYALPMMDYSIKRARNSTDVTSHICYCNNLPIYYFQLRRKSKKVLMLHEASPVISFNFKILFKWQWNSIHMNFCQLNLKIKLFSWTVGQSSQTANLKGKGWKAYRQAFYKLRAHTTPWNCHHLHSCTMGGNRHTS